MPCGKSKGRVYKTCNMIYTECTLPYLLNLEYNPNEKTLIYIRATNNITS